MKGYNYLLIFIIILFSNPGISQDEKIIKTSGKFVYSWAIERNLESARESAKIGLLDTIFVSLLKEKEIDETDTVFIKVIDYFEKKVGLKWQVIAFADKSDISVKLDQRKKKKAIPVVIGEQKVTNAKEDETDSIDKQAIPENSQVNEPSIDSFKVANTGNQVLDELLICQNANDLQKILYAYKSNLKLNYGYKSNYPDDSNCYIFVIDEKSNMIVAVYDKGSGSRKNFYTDTFDDNWLLKYKDFIHIYVVII